MTQRFDIAAADLARLYADLKCDGCGRALSATDAPWAKIGCSYFCPRCTATSPA